jgi:hypothetical protein
MARIIEEAVWGMLPEREDVMIPSFVCVFLIK